MTAGESSLTELGAALAGRYRVERQIGEGGMAAVYLARDERHDRQVAVKVVHEDLGASLGQERFLAEIKTTARLQHPHILPLLDSGSTAGNGTPGGRLYYVMPYVEGESLRDRLTRERQLPIEDALRIARETGDALAYAHEHGIVHRDVKPENILLQGGHALVADFGIALAVQQAGGARMTQTGLSLGTPQYMSPEQAAGEKTIDARADQYALAAVLYEMLTGEPPFTGATVQAVIAKVLGSEPEPPTTIRKTISPSIEATVLKALAKLPADRFQNVRAFVAALDSTTASGAATSRPATPASDSARVRARAWAVAGLAAGALVGVGLGFFVWRMRPGGAREGVSRTYVTLPAGETMATGTTDFAFAADGDLVYVGAGEAKNSTQLWRKRAIDLHATRIAGTEGARQPMLSPDGKFVAFSTDAGLLRVPLEGGAVTTISPDLFSLAGRGVWTADGHIVVDSHAILYSVTADGGRPVRVSSVTQFLGYEPRRVERLPGGNTVLVQVCPVTCLRSVIYAVDLTSNGARVVVPDGRNPVYLPTGQLAWISRTGQLMVAPFDAKSVTLRGAGKPVADRVAAFEVSARGDLLYREGDFDVLSRPTFVDRLGNATTVDSSWLGAMFDASLSSDGKRVAITVASANDEQIWVKDLPWGPFSKLTLDAGDHFRPTWSGDDRAVHFVQVVDSAFYLMERRVDVTTASRRVPADGRQVVDATSSA
ncbi:MAG TPA: protein kinase, partial [Gemmatimonadaceae bacterium]